MQEDGNGKYRPLLYESVPFSRVESQYSQPKLDLCGVARIVKKLQTILLEQKFEIQVDAKDLIEMINISCLPNAPIARLVACIQLFLFDLVCKQGKTFTIPDDLSRRPKGEEKEESERDDFDEDEDYTTLNP
ncbi:hypothetical protein O181_030671 [Austropuccinia psidii MF-1]|uniref:Reverse transcriptase RNase H-like domain-containing protein n=1 Tax=Austropuccinia psidii MF-1 TaxID=1389203 RepID=A0A9Q3CYY4_9BASI|nr:hypothetical protein [Austropuccinia psidii MF-1]